MEHHLQRTADQLKPMHHYGKFLSADGPPVYEGVGLVRTVERGNELAAALGNGPAVLMRAHGDAVVGESVEQVIERTTRLAMLGEWNHLALLHGEPKYLTAEELKFTTKTNASDAGGSISSAG
jgi:ribulose-5-phosphate 4-epimerase/fuculose-1-phosphate aldolase